MHVCDYVIMNNLFSLRPENEHRFTLSMSLQPTHIHFISLSFSGKESNAPEFIHIPNLHEQSVNLKICSMSFRSKCYSNLAQIFSVQRKLAKKLSSCPQKVCVVIKVIANTFEMVELTY